MWNQRETPSSIVTAKAVPVVGDVILGMVTELALKRWKDRITQLLLMFAEYLAELENEIVQKEFFRSEEFQSLLIEAIDQQRTERFEAKRKMLAFGLAQSGTQGFIEDSNKETFFRIVRDLSPLDLETLKRLSEPLSESVLPQPRSMRPRRSII